MKTFINRYATPLTTGLFLVSTVSGIALFFHWAPGAFHGMHEWLSMVLLVPFGLHLWKNWAALLGYLRRKTLLLPLLLCVLVALPFAASAFKPGPGGNPGFVAMQLLNQARLAELAPLLKASPEALKARLASRGMAWGSDEQTLAEVASANRVQPPQLLAALNGTGR